MPTSITPSCSRDLLETYDGQLTKSWVSSPPRKWGSRACPWLEQGGNRRGLAALDSRFRGNDAKGRCAPGNCGFDTGQAAVVREADQPGYPIGTVFGCARKIAEPGMRTHHHQHIGEPIHQDPKKGLRAVVPLLLQRRSIDAPDIDAVEAAGDS